MWIFSYKQWYRFTRAQVSKAVSGAISGQRDSCILQSFHVNDAHSHSWTRHSRVRNVRARHTE